jgi:hypothetical protein
VALVTFFALFTSWFNWGFSLIFSAVLARKWRAASRASTIARSRRRACSGSAASGRRAERIGGAADGDAGALQPQIRDIVAAGGLVPAA